MIQEMELNEIKKYHERRQNPDWIRSEFFRFLSRVPIMTVSQEKLVQFDNIKGIASGRYVIGTGFFTELTSLGSDLFGTKSKKTMEKYQYAETMALNMMRLEALKIGANAVVGVKIDNEEVGGSKAMAMIATSGTAVLIPHLEEAEITVLKAYEMYWPK